MTGKNVRSVNYLLSKLELDKLQLSDLKLPITRRLSTTFCPPIYLQHMRTIVPTKCPANPLNSQTSLPSTSRTRFSAIAIMTVICLTLTACDGFVRFRSDTIVCAKNGAGIQSIKVQERSGKKEVSFQRSNQVFIMRLENNSSDHLTAIYKDTEIDIDMRADELDISALVGNQYFRLNCASETSFSM